MPTATCRPILAESIPGREDGTLAADGKSVTWKLKKGVTWHDGKPFTADDCVFTWEYARNPATAAVTSGSYKDVVVEKVDQYTVVVKFQQPTPFWADAFVDFGRLRSFPSICSPTISATSRAMRRPTSSRSAPVPTSSRTSSRATW